MSVRRFECSLCMKPLSVSPAKRISEFGASESLSRTLEPTSTKCTHVFHQSCLKDWIEMFSYKSATCPRCDTSLTLPIVLLHEDSYQVSVEPLNVLVPSFSMNQFNQFTRIPLTNLNMRWDTSPLANTEVVTFFKESS